MSRCVRCHGRLRADAAFCSGCGVAVGEVRLEVETGVGPSGGAQVRDVVFAGPTLRRSRLVAAFVVAGLLAVVIAGVLSGGQRHPTTSSTTSTAPVTSTAPSTIPTTTLVASSEVAPVTTGAGLLALGPAPLLGESVGLDVIVGSFQRVYRIDLDAGIIAPLQIANPNDASFRWTSLGLLAVSNGGTPVLFPLDGSPPRLFEVPGSFLGEWPPGRLWFADYSSNGPTVRYLVPTAGSTAVAINTDGLPDRVALDSDSGLLLVAPGGIYRLQPPAPPQRISDGNLLGVSNGYIAEQSCDPHLTCRLAVLETRSGRRYPVPTPALFGPSPRWGVVVSPDGRWMLVSQSLGGFDNEVRAKLAVVGVDGSTVDLGTTDYTCISDCDGGPSWTTDGSWLIGMNVGESSGSSTQTLWAWRPGLTAPKVIPVPQPFGPSVVLVPHTARFSSASPQRG